MRRLRRLVNGYIESDWYVENESNIRFEINHLELHDLDDYLYSMYEKGIKSDTNPNNSNIAYLIGITSEEPHVQIATVGGSFPDIDLDFEHERREEVRHHLKERYGEDKVAAIGTFMQPKPKGLFKDVARLYDLDFKRSNEISKLIPDRPDLSTFDEALAEGVEFRELYENDELITKIVDYARRLEGTIKSTGIHACGMCISTDPITELVPLFESKGDAVTQFDGPTLEKIGLIKYDILGLKNLTTISRTIALVKKTQGHTIDMDSVPYEDDEYFDLISEGNSLGVFQVEGSKGLRDFAQACKPQSIEDLSAIISLYRPGPMGMGYLEKYIARRSGNQPAVFVLPDYHYIFQDTYGLMIYQEQFMILARDMSGFSDIRVDVLRKAVGKKDAKLLESLHGEFVEGAVKSNQNREVVENLWEELKDFGRYAFNKSHAICYAEIGCQTAWLKCNYISEYMAALISIEPDPEQQSIYIEDARRNGVEVLPPDINQSEKDFTVGKDGEILFGFNCIKGVGGRAVEKIQSIMPFDSFGDFLIKSFHAKGINKKVIEAMINCGACDVFGHKRSCMVKGFEKFLVDYASKAEKLFVLEHARPFLNNQDEYFDDDDMPEFPMLTILEYERTLLGIHVSGNPFDIVGRIIKEDFRSIEYLTQITVGSHFVLGQINKIKRLTTKKGDSMAFVDVLDHEGNNDSFVLFPNIYAKYSDQIAENNYVLIYCKVKVDDRGRNFLVNSIRDLTSEIDLVSSKIEAEKSMKSIDIHIVNNPGIVRLKSVLKTIEVFESEEESGYHASLLIHLSGQIFKFRCFNLRKIDISVLRAFGKYTDVYVSRGI
jgi:DNA polymerase-3 subunit alpha